MALTADERRRVQAAQLEKLVADLAKAMRDDDSPARQAALDALNDFSTAPVGELALRAQEAVLAASQTLVQQGVAQLRAIVGRLEPLTSVFADAALIAKTGKKELFVPRLAATAATMLETATAVKEAVEKLKTQVESVDDLGDVPDALDNVLTALEALQESVKTVS